MDSQKCSYQYATCTKPPDQPCPFQRNLPDIKEWLKVATQAHLCPFVGEALTKNEYELGIDGAELQRTVSKFFRS